MLSIVGLCRRPSGRIYDSKKCAVKYPNGVGSLQTSPSFPVSFSALIQVQVFKNLVYITKLFQMQGSRKAFQNNSVPLFGHGKRAASILMR